MKQRASRKSPGAEAYREREAPTALKLAAGVLMRRGYREKMLFSSNRSQN
jgi:hypothetical protein